MREIRCEFLACLILVAVQVPVCAQSTGSVPASAPPSSSSPDPHSVELERKLEAISSALAVTHQQLEQSQQEMEQLRQELVQIRKQLALSQSVQAESSSSASTVDAATTAAAIEDLKEQQQTTEAQVKVHDQTKVESSSKYPLRVTGLILFNSFVNRGSVDNVDLPEAALSNQNNTTGNRERTAEAYVRPSSDLKDLGRRSLVQGPLLMSIWISSVALPIAAMRPLPEQSACGPRASI